MSGMDCSHGGWPSGNGPPDTASFESNIGEHNVRHMLEPVRRAGNSLIRRL